MTLLLMVLTTVSAWAQDPATSGTCGDYGNENNVTWAVTDTDGDGTYETITISGTGATKNYSGSNPQQPWAAFKSDITTAVIGDGVTRIGGNAFYQFTALTSVTIASSVTTIGNAVFFECTNLATINGASGVTYVDSSAFDGTAWEKNLPNGLNYVGHVAYRFVGDGTSVNLDAATTRIYEYCFQDSKITSIVIPASVECIGDYAFAHSALQKMYVLRSGSNSTEITQLVYDAFMECRDDLVIVVPTAAYSTYSSHWYSYNSKLQHGYTVTCSGTGITFTSTNNGPLVEQGETVTLSYNNLPAGYSPVYTVKKASDNSDVTSSVLNGSEITMPAYNISVSAALVCMHSSLTAHPAVAPTCTDNGNTAYWECENCQKYFSDDQCTDEIAENSWEILATGHTLTEHPYVAPTCTDDGNSAYWECENCQKYFSDDQCTTEIAANEVVVAALGHQFNASHECNICHVTGIPYLDADGNTQYCTNFTVLTGSETSLSAGWYVAQGTINYDHQIYFNGTVHLILADGCKMTVEPTNDNQVRAIEAGNLTIYAQSNGSAAGSLTAIINYPQDNSAGTAAIMGVRLTINGGNITARSTNTGNTTNAGHGGIAGQSGLTINGGNIVATSESTEKGCGITGPITINWNNDNCSLYFYPYRNDGFGGYMKIADGKAISDGTNTYSGTLSEEQKAAIVRKLLTPPTRTLTANSDGNGNYWATYYNGSTSYTADANTTIYKGAVNGNSVQLTSVADIPAGNAVILKSTASPITLTRTTKSGDFTDNDLKGTDTEIVPPANTYCMAKGASGVGFYQYSATNGNIPANRAYLIIPGSTSASQFFGFDENISTGIDNVQSSLSESVASQSKVNVQSYYNLAGQRVAQPTKGMYIVNGKKVVIK